MWTWGTGYLPGRHWPSGRGVWRQTLSVEHYNPYLHAMSQMPLPLTRVPLHTGRDPLRWMRDDRHRCLAWTRAKREGAGIKKSQLSVGQTKQTHAIIYWARIQIDILLLTELVGLMYAVVLSFSWLHITRPAAWGSTETLVKNLCLTGDGSSPIFMSVFHFCSWLIERPLSYKSGHAIVWSLVFRTRRSRYRCGDAVHGLTQLLIGRLRGKNVK